MDACAFGGKEFKIMRIVTSYVVVSVSRFSTASAGIPWNLAPASTQLLLFFYGELWDMPPDPRGVASAACPSDLADDGRDAEALIVW